MSESMRIARRRNMMVFNNFVDRAPEKPDRFGGYDLYNTFRAGAVETGLAPEPEPTPQPYNLQSELLHALDVILTYAAKSNLGPTRSSRIYYLWFFSTASAYQWVCSAKRVTGNKDSWNWEIQNPLQDEQSLCVWMLLALEVIMAKFPVTYSAPWEQLSSTYLLSEGQLAVLKSTVQTTGDFTTWTTSYNTWWTARAADGSVAALTPPTDADLPNGATRLDVAGTADPATFPQPLQWTPLKVGANSQRYMTYNWNSVISPCLTPVNQTTIYAAAAAEYPTLPERTSEINEVVTITNNLTDAQKVIAEFWAGGPFTVSPPGMLVWIWKYYVTAKGVDPSVFLFSGLDLTLHLFETGRIVWGLKKTYMQARPIQEIRRLYRGQTLTKYDGTSILGESWVPYQETNFVTPPFADFPSGHSAFSRSFANVMTDWFGESIQSGLRVSMEDISLLSPALVPQTNPLCMFVFNAGASLIEVGQVPKVASTLLWNTWYEISESAGISRKYGGIHATSAHTGSVAAANALHSAINANFPIAKS